MIVFDLRCTTGHVFEAWFASSAAYAEQREDGKVTCPLCGDRQIEKAVMAPQIAAKSNRSISANTRASAVMAPQIAAKSNRKPDLPNPQAVKAVMEQLAQAQAKMLEKSTWVGTGFAEQARAMHEGDAPVAPIHGQASVAEAKALADEGVPVAPLPFPVVPPKLAN